MRNTKFAFDLGGVVIERGALENRIIEESYISIKLTVEKFGNENVFIISKAKEKYIERNIKLLNDTQFFTITKFKPQNIYFVNEYEDKGTLGKKLGLNYILDDSVKVARIAKQSGFEPIVFGQQEQFHKDNPGFMKAKNWKQFRRVLEKIQK